MLTLDDLQRATGYSDDQLRDRVGRLRARWPQRFRSGPKGKILADEPIRDILMQMAHLERDRGLSPKDAEAEAAEGGESAQQTQPERTPKLSEGWRKYIEQLERENQWLRERVETLEPLALPAPRRGPLAWLGELFRRDGAT